jgi:hypothetical protein
VDSSTNGSLTSAAVGVDGRGAGSSTDPNHGAALNQPAAAGRWSQSQVPAAKRSRTHHASERRTAAARCTAAPI